MLLAVASVDVEGNSTELLSLWKKSKSVSIPVRGTDQFSPPGFSCGAAYSAVFGDSNF